MPEQNAATSGANNSEGTNTGATGATGSTEQINTGANTGATAGANQTAGTTEAQTGAAGNQAFTPEQQARINSLIKAEKDKAVAAAEKKFNEEKDLTAKELAEKRATDAETALAERDKRDAFLLAIAPAKVIDANGLYKLIGDEIEFENGKIKNLTKSLESAKTAYPYLFPTATGSADAGAADDKSVPESTPGRGRMRDAYAATAKKT